MIRHLKNNYAACALVVAIRACASLGKWFIDALKRRADESRGGRPATGDPAKEQILCRKLLSIIEKGPGDTWKRRVNVGYEMSGLRECFGQVTWAHPEMKKKVGLPPYVAVDAVINLLHPDDQRRFKLINLKAVQCDGMLAGNVPCDAVRTFFEF